jgi:hypothetical protein
VKRIVIGAAVIATVMFVAVAFANKRHYFGSVQEGGTVKFATKVRGDETVKVKRFIFKRVPMECDNGPSTVGDAGSPPPAMRVNDEGEFRGRFTSPNGRKHLRIRGSFRDQDGRARGILRVWGNFGSGATNCNTGKTHWRASHGI